MWDADFYNADLRHSELRMAEYHREASWEKAKYQYTELNGVDFSYTNMKGADFECANLEGADLSGTDLRDANLKGARLKGAKLRRFDGLKYAFAGDTAPDLEDLSDDQIAHKTNLIGATMPDGTEFTIDTDFSYLRRFTNPSDEMLQALDR